MLKRSLHVVLALVALLALPLAIAACGGDDNDVPSNAVAVVDGKPITMADYQRWFAINAKMVGQQRGTTAVPDPPAYTKCIAVLRKTRRAGKGKPTPTESSLRTECRQLEKQIRDQTVTFLIQAAALEKEAQSLKISVTQAELDRRRKEQYPKEKDFQKYLRANGMTAQDFMVNQRLQELVTKITEKVRRGTAPVTAKAIAAYYAKNKEQQFDQPETRDVQVILTETKAQAEKAKQAIEKGTSWKAAADQFSTDTTSKQTGGVIADARKDGLDRELGEAAFTAKKNTLIGPFESQFGWYLIRVTKVVPQRLSTLATSRDQIRQTLTQQAEQEKFARFAEDFQKRWAAKTGCSKDYVVPGCSNAPKQTTTATAGGGGQPQPQ